MNEDVMQPAFFAPLLRFATGMALLVWGLAPASAQSTGTPAKPDPLNPQAHVPPLVYRPSLPQPKNKAATTAEPKPPTWREANDNVARIGGWRTYAREAQAPEVAAPAATASPAAPVAPSSNPAKPVPPAAHKHP
jgi:hypothetical protein